MSFHFMVAITIYSDFGAQKIKSDTVSPSTSHEVMGQDATVRTGHGTMDWFKIGKERNMSRLYIVTLLI